MLIWGCTTCLSHVSTISYKLELMDKEVWIYTREFIQSTLALVQFDLDKESIDAINHYLRYDEYEMAFEGLFIEIMSLETIPAVDIARSKEVGQLLKLNEESVFDSNFWRNFEDYVKKSNENKSQSENIGKRL